MLLINAMQWLINEDRWPLPPVIQVGFDNLMSAQSHLCSAAEQ